MRTNEIHSFLKFEHHLNYFFQFILKQQKAKITSNLPYIDNNYVCILYIVILYKLHSLYFSTYLLYCTVKAKRNFLFFAFRSLSFPGQALHTFFYL